MDEITKSGKSLKTKIENLKQQIARANGKMASLQDPELEKNLASIFDEMQGAKATMEGYTKELIQLSEAKGVLKQTIKNEQEKLAKNTQPEETKKLETEIKILEFAITDLIDEREKRSKSIIELFENTLLGQLHKFGLKQYTDAKISRTFKLEFLKHGEKVSFENISPGEQVRVKLAFYLSIIQLDITHSYGRHPRFIILDTPAKEEGDKVYLDGLKETLKDIEKEFNFDLQLFVGTAERKLEGALPSKKQHIKKAGEPFF